MRFFKRIKSIRSAVITAGVMSLLLVSSTFAYGAQSMSYDFSSGSLGKAFLDGSLNGKYYNLAPGSANLSAKNTEGKGTLYITLYREKTGIDQNYGTKTISVDTNTNISESWNVDIDNNKYYLYLKGTGDYITYKGSGTLGN